MAGEGFGKYGVPLLDLLAAQPLVTPKYVAQELQAAPTTAGSLLDRVAAVGIVDEVTGTKRNRVYRYSSYLDMFTTDRLDAPGQQEEI